MAFKLLCDQAREKAKMPADWFGYKFRVLPESLDPAEVYEITGAVAPLKARAAGEFDRDWRKKDRSTVKVVFITVQDHKAWIRDWEKRTGKCSVCLGDGKQWMGWSLTNGDKYEPCRRCRATGAAPGEGVLMAAVSAEPHEPRAEI